MAEVGNILLPIAEGIAISGGSYAVYQVANKVLRPKMCKLLLLWKTKRFLDRNRLLRVYICPLDASQILKRELEEDPLDEIRKVFKEVHEMKSIIDDKPVMRYLLDIMTTGIIIAEKTPNLKYRATFMKCTNHISGNSCTLYSGLQTLNDFILRKNNLSAEATRMLIVELERANVLT